MAAPAWFRLLLRIPDAYVAHVRASNGPNGQHALLSDIETRLAKLGWGDASVVQDPTDERVFSAIACRKRSSAGDHDDALAIVGAEPVSAPPPILDVNVPRSLDPGLTPDAFVTLEIALGTEENQRHLRGLASTFEPAFVISGALLRAKADLLDLRRNRTAARSSAGSLEKALVRASAGLGATVANMWARLSRDAGLTAPAEAPPSATEIASASSAVREYEAATRLPRDVVSDQVKSAADLLVSEPLDLDVSEIPVPIVLGARALVRNVGSGVRLIDAAALRSVCPPTGREGYVSPSATKLALATMKPRWSRIERPEEAARLCRELQAADPRQLDALRARAEIARAMKAIERQRWIEWYRKLSITFPNHSNPGTSGALRIGSFKLSRPRAGFFT